ncbi:hypothetical protein CEE37_15085 [candidate division LCP-89 bacterium B3_LCP]|uniref:Uncharacterized protein n=1 Tax=candidate division LCP-89 bacterium B3_LCP TaxID=2012998 RepID=A0A532UNL1_UNCL8|nr:MAG: hypothetical protein CEE37_15085 [candidate division LCP-89 bacterium B3_LCP]
MKRLIIISFILILIPLFVLTANNQTVPLKNYPYMTGREDVRAPVAHPPYPGYGTTDLGTTTVIGTTWYELQHNGTVGRMIERSADGYTDFVWMNGEDWGAISRHIYYNYIDPSGVQGWPGSGYPVEASQRAGYTTMDVEDWGAGGIAFPCYHSTPIPGGDFWTVTAADLYSHTGSFVTYEAPNPYNPQLPEIIWPRIQFDNQQALQIVSTVNPYSMDPQRHYWIRGTYDPLTFSISYEGNFELMTWTMTIAGDVATSEVSDKVAYAWTWCKSEGFPSGSVIDFSQRNNDIYLVVDYDGEDPDWTDFVNITCFMPPDLSWLPDTLMANMDTLRAYTDLNVFIDQDDFVHVVFTTPSYFAVQGETHVHPSLIWHWTSQYPDEDPKMIHDAFDDWWWNSVDCGAWNVKAQRPQLGQDPATGYLYCMYQVYDCDTLALSEGGFPSGEIYLSYSEDLGLNWHEGTNITETITPNNAAPGACLSEITPSMAKLVNDTCHIMYVLDRDAGTVVQTEGSWTLNDVVYHQVPVGDIPATPLVPQFPEPGSYPFHGYGIPPPNMFVEVTYVSGSPVPASGGNLYYAIWGENQAGQPLDYDIWIDKIYQPGQPDSTVTTLILREITNYLPGWQINRPDAWFPVPGDWPGGEYAFQIYTGWHPEYTVWHNDMMYWVKDGPVDSDFDFEANLPLNAPDPFEQIAITQVDYTVPEQFEVTGVYPNPFNATTVLSFSMRVASLVTLDIFDVNGRNVGASLRACPGSHRGLPLQSWYPPGTHQITFDGTDLPSGMYIYRITAGEFTVSGKMVLMK